MLSPKRVKHRKQHRGRRAGLSRGQTSIQFGEYGLKSLDAGWLTNRQIEAARIAMTRKIKRGGKVWINVYPDKSFTKKPAETRMGSGKGSPEGWVAVVKPGRVMFELAGVSEPLAREAMRLAGHKLPVKTKFVMREDTPLMNAKDLRELPESELVEHVATTAQGGLRPALPARHGRAREHRRPAGRQARAGPRPDRCARARDRHSRPEVAMADETPETEQTTHRRARGAAAPAAPKLSGKEERARRDHLAKSQRGPRTTEERDAERRELRKAKAVARRRRREQEKAKRAATGEKGTGTPPAPPKDSSPQVRTGTVVSAKPDKTIVVRIDVARRHRKYEKIVRSTTKLHAHDETNDAGEGDLVRVSESRPLSRTKRWKLEEVLERAK